MATRSPWRLVAVLAAGLAAACTRAPAPTTIESQPVAKPAAIVLPAPAAGELRLEGIVRTAAGAPVADAEVTIVGTRAATVTSADGWFAFDGLAAGSYQLRVTAPGRPPRVVQHALAADAEPVDLQLP